MKSIAIIAFLSCLFVYCDAVVHADHAPARQWQVTELTFAARFEYPDPFDIEQVRFLAEFRGPDGRRLSIPGFWDGGTTWRIRFTPTLPGSWSYETRFTNEKDEGLHAKRGWLFAREPTGETELRKHGGFLAVSDNRRYLTYADGTPFFWLGDTWWRVPSASVPFEHFKQMVETRVSQGFTVFQAVGHDGFGPPSNKNVFDSIRLGGDAALQFWRATDQYLDYAESVGIVGVVGFGGYSSIDRVELSELKKLWWSYIARYGAYPITFLITQEYNSAFGDNEGRVSKIIEIGRFIREIDPYRRAMTVHPSVQTRDKGEAWNEDWYSFAMLQGGHFARPDCDSYLAKYTRRPRRPILEAELNYEGFQRGTFSVDAAVVRKSAYVAIQCGAFGFSYGAQGLYGGVTDTHAPGPTAKWGPVLTWQAGIALPGSVQMLHLRTFYESVPWWRLEPWPAKLLSGPAVVKSAGLDLFALYLPAHRGAAETIELLGFADRDSRYEFRWYDPRTGKVDEEFRVLIVSGGVLRIPPPPDENDWLAVLHLKT